MTTARDGRRVADPARSSPGRTRRVRTALSAAARRGWPCCSSPTGGRPAAASRTWAAGSTGADLARPATGLVGLGPAARPGAADGAGAASRAGLRPGPARPPPPAGRLHVVQPDARPRRADHLGLRRRVDSLDVPQTFWDLVVNYPGMLLALGGTAALVMVVVTSIKAARRRLRYESWHLIHLYAYLGVGLALPHQLWTGTDFTRRPAAPSSGGRPGRVAAGAVLVWRVGLPLWTQRCGTGCASPASCPRRPASWSVYLTGRRLHRLRVEAGQFLSLAVPRPAGLDPANPYSLSAAPDGRSLRITVADVGDGSAAVAALTPGHAGRSSRARTGGSPTAAAPGDRVAYFGAGVGITPLRALAEGLAVRAGRRHRCSSASATEPLFAASSTCSPASAGLQVVEPPRPPPRRRTPGSATASDVAASTTRPCCGTGCPTSPSATSTSAARPPGPTAVRAPCWPPGSRRPAPPRDLQLVTPMKRIATWFLSTADGRGAAVRLPHLDRAERAQPPRRPASGASSAPRRRRPTGRAAAPAPGRRPSESAEHRRSPATVGADPVGARCRSS